MDARTPYSKFTPPPAKKVIKNIIVIVGKTKKRRRGQFENWAFGCDICQEVCPWNRFSQPHAGGEFSPLKHLDWSVEEWEELTEGMFRPVRRKSAMNRIKWAKLKGNVRLWKLDRPSSMED